MLATDGCVSRILNLLKLSIAFFIAALAAIATFDRPEIYTAMKGEPAVMKRTAKDIIVRNKIITHGQFMGYSQLARSW